jgi:hypothetical protein
VVAQITKADLQEALRNWEVARENARMQHMKLAAFLEQKKEQIALDREQLNRSTPSNGWSHQERIHKDPDYATTFDHAAHATAMKKIEDLGQTYLELKEKFVNQ